MTPDDSKPVTAAVNRKSSKASRNKATAVVTSMNRSITNNDDLFLDPDDETCYNIEYLPPGRPSRLLTDASTDDNGPGDAFPPRKRPLLARSTQAPTRSKGKGRHRILVPGTPEPDDNETKPANLSTEERCYQELLNARREVSPISGT